MTAWLVPGSKRVEAQIIEEGLKDISLKLALN